ncbi:hypothetical protein NDU88_005173 [Pleurodeles waltl]|uniref:Uncharacterized protein n=1 Tax=Pleurodeles waltl TaxID=8319 RepID=A0AAV7PHS6_PLEWA|nr:hypothetical protein NDU88_005173 [Pleurodeles waltl]
MGKGTFRLGFGDSIVWLSGGAKRDSKLKRTGADMEALRRRMDVMDETWALQYPQDRTEGQPMETVVPTEKERRLGVAPPVAFFLMKKLARGQEPRKERDQEQWWSQRPYKPVEKGGAE